MSGGKITKGTFEELKDLVKAQSVGRVTISTKLLNEIKKKHTNILRDKLINQLAPKISNQSEQYIRFTLA